MPSISLMITTLGFKNLSRNGYYTTVTIYAMNLDSTAYPQQEKQPPTNPGLPVTGVFDQGARIDPNKPVQVPVSSGVLILV